MHINSKYIPWIISYNLIDNFDFSDSDMSFWENTSGSLLGDNLNIVNTGHIVQGKAMHYENNRLYPRGIYYIKWVDVKPNTEYTFSARYAISSFVLTGCCSSVFLRRSRI